MKAIYSCDDFEMRLLGQEDSRDLFDFVERNRSYLKEWLGWLDVNQVLADTEQYVFRCEEERRKNAAEHFLLWQNEKLIASLTFHQLNWLNHFTTIGYMLDKNAQGRGIMSKATSVLVDYAFKEYGLNRVEIRCAVENRKSRKIPERLGFSLEGISRENEFLYDHYVDLAIYSILKKEWEGSSNPYYQDLRSVSY